jgi:hypothetical protein
VLLYFLRGQLPWQGLQAVLFFLSSCLSLAPLLPALSPPTQPPHPLCSFSFSLLTPHSSPFSHPTLVSLNSVCSGSPYMLWSSYCYGLVYGLVIVSFFWEGGNRLCACMCFPTRMHMYVLSHTNAHVCAFPHECTCMCFPTRMHMYVLSLDCVLGHTSVRMMDIQRICAHAYAHTHVFIFFYVQNTSASAYAHTLVFVCFVRSRPHMCTHIQLRTHTLDRPIKRTSTTRSA